MAISKEVTDFNVFWEDEYGYSQAVKVRDTIYLSGQVSHDAEGNIVGEGNMEVQMRTAYANVIRVLERYGATIDNVVNEMLFVTNIDAAYVAHTKMKQEIFSGSPIISSTIVEVQRLVFPQLMIELKCIAVV